MNLHLLSNDHLESRLQKLVKTERKITHLVLQCIAEIDRRKLYTQRAYSSLFDFLVQAHGYSPSAAMRRIDGARLLQQIPEVAEKIENGALNLSQVALLQRAEKEIRRETKSMIPVELKRELLDKIEHQTQAKTEQLIAQTLNIEISPKNKIIQHRDESVTVTMTLSKEQIEVLEQVQAQLSHAVPEKNWATLVTYLAKKELARRAPKQNCLKSRDTVKKAAEVVNVISDCVNTKSKESNTSGSTSDLKVALGPAIIFTTATEVKRKPLPQSLRKQLLHTNATCVYRDPRTGKACGSRHFLQVDHIQSVSRGGGNDPANLQVLCGQHNRYKFLLENKKPD